MKKKTLIFGLLVALLLGSGITLSIDSKASASGGCSSGDNVCSKVVVVDDDESTITVIILGNKNQ